MAGHSDLPWVNGLDLPGVANNNPDDRIIWSGSTMIGSMISVWVPGDEQSANAALVVLAGNSHGALLEAAKRAERILAAMVDRQWSEGYDPVRDMIDAWPQLRAAIALATPSASKE